VGKYPRSLESRSERKWPEWGGGKVRREGRDPLVFLKDHQGKKRQEMSLPLVVEVKGGWLSKGEAEGEEDFEGRKESY